MLYQHRSGLSCLSRNMSWWNRRTSLFWIYCLQYNLFTVPSRSFTRISWEHSINIRQRCWLQQDDAPAHFHHDVKTFLDEQNHWIGREKPVPWPPRSPDLNPLDFFFWVYSKNIVYENAPITRLDMMNRIKRVCEGITPEILRSVLKNFESRLRLCLRNNGEHFEHLIRRSEWSSIVFFHRSCLHWLAHTRTHKRGKFNHAISARYTLGNANAGGSVTCNL